MRELALAQILLPMLLAAWLAIGRAPSRADLALRLAAAWLLLAGIWLAGIWLAMPRLTIGFLAILMAFASVMAVRRMRSRLAVGARQTLVLWSGRTAALAGAAFGLWLIVPALAGRGAPPSAVDLAFPFRSGRYLVVNGGTAERINGHFMTLEPRFALWRGESYAVDLIKVDRYGFRTRRRRLLALPADPAAYLSFGEPVHAPCAGTVEAVEGGRPDMAVPVRDRRNLEGNFVRLRCGSVVVFLGHFRRGGVRVHAGQPVSTGDLLGSVGNSGNSDEPHLHIHAQRRGPASAPLSGEPLFVTFDGRFLVRNNVVAAGR
jgi:hypothetical protein